MLRRHDFLVDAGEHKTVGVNSAQFFHEVEGEAPAPGPGAVEKADVGVEAHTLKSRCAVGGQKRISEGEQGIGVVQRRTAASASERKIIVLLQDEGIKAVKIPLCRLALQAAKLVEVVALLDKGQRRRQLSAGALELFHRHPLGMVAGGPFQHPAGVIDFAQDEIARIETALCLAVCDAVLGLPQQDVAPLFAYGPGQKAALRAEKAQIDPEAGAFAHQGRACAGIAETDDAFQRVERDPANFSLVAEQDDVLPLEGKVGVPVEDVERVQKLSHGAASCISSRWARR